MNIDSEFAAVVIKLFKGPLYNDDTDWASLILLQAKVRDYLAVLGLELNFYEAEGFAFISQPDTEETEQLPRLVSRRRISFEATLLSVILREELDRFELSNSESSKLYIEKNEIRERIRIYFKEKTDETRLFRELNKYINQVESLGFLKKVNTGTRGKDDLTDNELYEVRYIIKAKVDPSFLEDFKKRLEVYVSAL